MGKGAQAERVIVRLGKLKRALHSSQGMKSDTNRPLTNPLKKAQEAVPSGQYGAPAFSSFCSTIKQAMPTATTASRRVQVAGAVMPIRRVSVCKPQVAASSQPATVGT